MAELCEHYGYLPDDVRAIRVSDATALIRRMRSTKQQRRGHG
jgi:hypothetical protein